MHKVFPILCLLLLSCDFSLNGDLTNYVTIPTTTTVHKPLTFNFAWRNDSLVTAYVYLESYKTTACSSCSDVSGCSCKITSARYALISNATDEDSLNVEEKIYSEDKIDSTLVKLLYFTDSSQHIKFSLQDSSGTIKSYDLDLGNVFSYIDAKHYEIRGDSIDIFLPAGNFYLWYPGSCYNGIDNFSDLSYHLSDQIFYAGSCTRYKSSTDPQTITLEIAALYSLYFEVRSSFASESSEKTDSISFSWHYSNAL